MPLLNRTEKSILLSLGFALLYMGLLWLIYTRPAWTDRFSVMTYSFLFGAPFVIGAAINSFAPREDRGRAINLLWRPALFSLVPLLVALLVKIEGIICIIMAAPICFLLSSLGAVTFYLASRRFHPGKEKGGLAALMVLPILAGPLESMHIPARSQTVTETEVLIEAPARIVWENIIRVPLIRKEELPFGISKLMGFPDPVEATLSREGPGGVRQARFEGNVLFTETVTRWDDLRTLEFSIEANTEDIPPATMDEHMIVGGDYFDVLEGRYDIVEMREGLCLLKLRSTHVSITNFNFLTDLWGRAVMRDIQNRILAVIKTRCEAGAGVSSARLRQEPGPR
jgi:hypothetical protein